MKNLNGNLSIFFSKFFPILIIVLVVFVFFWKVFLWGYVAVPADILVRENYPVKNPITTDAVSFSYPMKYVVIDDLKRGMVPLWNPYILFGTPLLANFQSGVFSVTNIFYFVMDFKSGWNFQIITQHVFAAFFMYVLLRHWKISKIAALVGGISFAFGGFNLIWSEWNAHTLTAAFIPLLVFFTDRFIKKRKIYDGAFLSSTLALQIFSGYPQIVLYSIPALLIMWIISFKSINRQFLLTGLYLGVFIMLGVGIACPQILPGIELLKLSQRSSEAIPKIWAFLSWRQVITFIAPDFYGNHATNNYWGDKNYTSNIGFVGVAVFTLALFSLKFLRKRKEIIFLLILVSVSLVFAFPTPIANFLWEKNILGLKAGASYRILVLFSFAMSALAAFGYDFLDKSLKGKWRYVIFVFVLLCGFWIYAYTIHNVVALRNLVLPTGIFAFTAIAFWKPGLKLILPFFMLVELFYFGWKFMPFVPREIVFPKDKIIEYLKSFDGIFRVVGGDVIHVDTNMVYGLEFASGYDAEYPSTTSKFLGVLNSGNANASPQDRYGLITNKDSRLLDLANVRFFLTSEGVIENKKYIPRYFSLDEWEVEDNDEKVLTKLLDPNFPLSQKIILDREVVKKKNKSMFFVSDTYYPGWRAFVDGVETQIYRADFAFRAIEVPKGEYEVKMTYEPESFRDGLKISLGSLGVLIIIGIIGWIWRRNI